MYDPGQLYVDPILSNFSVGYKDQNLYGLALFPETPVRTQSGKYRVYDRSSWLIRESRREPGTVANEISGRKWSQDTFETQEHSLQAAILDEERQALTSLGGLANPTFGGDLSLDPEQDAAADTVQGIMLAHEKKVADTIRNTANYPSANHTALVTTHQWDDYDFVTPLDEYSVVSNPVGDIRAGMNVIYAATKRWPNTLAMPTQMVPIIENHPRIVKRFQNFTLSAPDAFRVLTGFQGNIVLVDSVYNSSNNVDAAESVASFWGKDVWLGIVDPTPGQKTKTFGKTFAQIYPGGQVMPTDRWREEPRKADMVRNSYKYDLKIVSSSAGYLIQTAVSTGAF